MANRKPYRPGGCSGCNNGCGQGACGSYGSNLQGGCNTCGNTGCASCSASCSGCTGNNGRSSFGALRSVSGPFSNCGNWNMNPNFPFYTGPCGPCEACTRCCCSDWPWPWPPFMPMGEGAAQTSGGYTSASGNSWQSGNNACTQGAGYNTSSDCGCATDTSAEQTCAAGQPRPISNCSDCGCNGGQ